MTFLALLILGILWAVVLVPPLIQRIPQLTSRPARTTVGGFGDQLSRMERPNGSRIATNGVSLTGGPRSKGEPLMPPSAAAAARRRRDVLGSLIALALFFLVATTMFGRYALYAHLAIDALAIAFGVMMLRRGRFQAERQAVVTQLPQRQSVMTPIADPVDVELDQYRKIS